MYKYELRHNLWLYHSTSFWKQVKRELGIILIFMLLAGILVLIANQGEKSVETFREHHLYANK